MAATKVVVINAKTRLALPSTKLILQCETIYAKETCSSPCFCAGQVSFRLLSQENKNEIKKIMRNKLQDRV